MLNDGSSHPSLTNATRSAMAFGDMGTDMLLRVMPNPASAHVQFVMQPQGSGALVLELFDMNGKKVADLYQSNANTLPQLTIDYDVSDLPNGMYFVRLFNNGTVRTERMQVVK
jgi:hypothetical protein